MENEIRLKPKSQHQLERQKVVREERALRRARELEAGICNSDGVIVGTARNLLQSVVENLANDTNIISASIEGIGLPIRHSDGTFHIALEFCPLYTDGTSLEAGKLVADALSEEDIFTSRVGEKWRATKRVIEELHDFTQAAHTQLVIHATFADIGVMVANEEDKNEAQLVQHGQLYRRLLETFCDQLQVPMLFQRLSDIKPVSQDHIVAKFIIGKGSHLIPSEISLEQLIELLGRVPEEIPLSSSQLRKKAKSLHHLLVTCAGNLTILKGLVDTYLNYSTTRDVDMHIGMERMSSNIDLQVIHRESDIAKIPRLNIIVK